MGISKAVMCFWSHVLDAEYLHPIHRWLNDFNSERCLWSVQYLMQNFCIKCMTSEYGGTSEIKYWISNTWLQKGASEVKYWMQKFCIQYMTSEAHPTFNTYQIMHPILDVNYPKENNITLLLFSIAWRNHLVTYTASSSRSRERTSI